jgi:hypothetical protein
MCIYYTYKYANCGAPEGVRHRFRLPSVELGCMNAATNGYCPGQGIGSVSDGGEAPTNRGIWPVSKSCPDCVKDAAGNAMSNK